MRIAWRFFTKNRGLAALAAATLAIAIGLATALAGVADAVLFRPLPVTRPGEIVRIYTGSATQPLGFVSYPDFEDFRGARTLAGTVAQTQVLIAAGEPAQVRMALAVTPDYFATLGVAVAPGRGFRHEESRDAVVVLSNAFWKSQFGGDPRAVGRTIRLCGVPFTIIGVAPENFGLDRFSNEAFYFPIEVYATGRLPISGQPLTDRARRYLSVYARLAPGAAMEQARSELAAIGMRLERQFPADRGRRVVALDELEARTRTDRTMPALVALLGGIALLILAIACANVAALLILRAEARGKEIAIKIAIGATPARLLAENLIESAALAIAGATLGIPLAWAAMRLLARAATLPTDLPFSIAPRIDLRAGAVLIAIATLSALVCGAAPLKVRAAGKLRAALVATEVALATAVIGCGGSLLGAIARAEKTDLGYRTDHVLVVALDPAQVGYGETQARAFYHQVLDRVRTLDGVKSAELAQTVPLGYTAAQEQIVIANETLTVWRNIVGPRYFDLMRLPIVEGRGFEDADLAANPPVAIVNQELAKRCGVGCTFHMNSRQVRVIGIARTAKYFAVGETPRLYFYLPFSQKYASRMVLHVETSGDPAAMAHAVADEIHRLDASQPLSEIRPLSDYVTSGAMFQARIGLRVMAAVGLAGIALALAGIYAVVSNAVLRRRREIGIRIAIGARRSDLLLLFARGTAGLIAAGIAAGSIAAAALSRLLDGLVAGTGSNPAILLLSAVAVFLVSTPAYLIPAWEGIGKRPAERRPPGRESRRASGVFKTSF